MKEYLGIIGIALVVAGVAILSTAWALITAGAFAIAIELAPFWKRTEAKD